MAQRAHGTSFRHFLYFKERCCDAKIGRRVFYFTVEVPPIADYSCFLQTPLCNACTPLHYMWVLLRSSCQGPSASFASSPDSPRARLSTPFSMGVDSWDNRPDSRDNSPDSRDNSPDSRDNSPDSRNTSPVGQLFPRENARSEFAVKN